ncbi:GDSL-type esterase/lipase family protein [Streptomonospora sp. S1-112]|uniref:GDSL-type esterase/lipase family protein n=1 Tax=Streptomonospora mangrovi TaxID=2883123 RepID=A0A9X3SEA7_9ACTN|nr:GDSL-type esterase/lipase family protein [Streptomonospora mangrovi]MDA0564732.1 GDSL-type esterase/lipase family protein [Streptomonospora mangrovi]
MSRSSTTKRIAAAVSALVLAGLVAAGAVGYLTFVRSPVNPSAADCADGRPRSEGPVVVAAGASMTQGTLGRDWVADLRARPEFADHTLVNAGDNGNTSADLRERLDTDVLACEPDAVVLLIGTNDVRDGVPLAEYRANIAAIVQRVEERTSAQVALLSLPPLGEELDSRLNRRLRDYNAALRTIAEETTAAYVPVNEHFTEALRDQSHRPAFAFSFPTAYAAAARHYLLGRTWDEVARANGLELYVDHIHLSDKGGAIVTGLVADWLATAAGPDPR